MIRKSITNHRDNHGIGSKSIIDIIESMDDYIIKAFEYVKSKGFVTSVDVSKRLGIDLETYVSMIEPGVEELVRNSRDVKFSITAQAYCPVCHRFFEKVPHTMICPVCKRGKLIIVNVYRKIY